MIHHLSGEQLSYFTMQISYPEIPDNINTTKQLTGFLKESPAKVRKSHLSDPLLNPEPFLFCFLPAETPTTLLFRIF